MYKVNLRDIYIEARTFRLSTLLLSLMLPFLYCQTAYAEHRFLSANDFKKHVFRGFTLEVKNSIGTDEDMEFLEEMGVNIVRVGLGLRRCSGCSEYTLHNEGLEKVKRVIDKARQHNFYVVITLVPENPYNAPYWNDPRLQNSIADAWGKLAQRYVDMKEVAGYDILNEPKPPGRIKESSRRWEKFASKIIDSIREVDKNHIIFYEPAPSGSAYGFKAIKKPIPYENIVYSLHLYKHISITHQGINDNKLGVVYPNAKWNKQAISKYLQPVREFTNKFNIPVYVGELGCVRWAPDNSAYRWIRDALDLIEEENWSWTFHSFRGWHGWDQELPSMQQRKPKDSIEASLMRRSGTDRFTLLRHYISLN
jgi:hypothetical protein